MTPTTATGFNDPTAQRLEAIATGAEPEVVGPLLADALRDHGGSAATSRSSRPQVQPHPASPATPARSSCAARRSGTSCRPRTTWSAAPRADDALEGRGRPGAARTLHRRRRQRARGAVLRHGARASGASAATRCPRGTPTRPKGARPSARRSSTCSPSCTPSTRRRGARGLRPAGGLHGAPAAALVQAVGGLQGARGPGARRAARRARAHAAAPARGGDRPRRLPARRRGAAPDRRRAASWPCSTRRSARSGTPSPTSARCSRSGARRRTTRCWPRRASSHPSPRPRLATRSQVIERYAVQTSFDVTDADSYQAFAFFKLAVVCRGSPRAPPAAPCSARASTTRSASSPRWSMRAATCSPERASARQAPDGQRPVEERRALRGRRRGRGRGHRTDIPPSTLSTWPVTKLLPAPSRKSTASSSSPARPPRRNGVRASRNSGKASGLSPSSAVISEAKTRCDRVRPKRRPWTTSPTPESRLAWAPMTRFRATSPRVGSARSIHSHRWATSIDLSTHASRRVRRARHKGVVEIDRPRSQVLNFGTDRSHSQTEHGGHHGTQPHLNEQGLTMTAWWFAHTPTI